MRRLRPVEPLVAEPLSQPEIQDPRIERMREEIGRLPEEMRETLLLKLNQELSYAEIAAVLAIPIGTVRSRIHQAVSRLRLALGQNTPSP